MTLLFATVEEDDICQMLFILVIRFMLLYRRTLFCHPSSLCQADIYKIIMKQGSSHLISFHFFTCHILLHLCVYNRIGVSPPMQDLVALFLPFSFTFPFSLNLNLNPLRCLTFV